MPCAESRRLELIPVPILLNEVMERIGMGCSCDNFSGRVQWIASIPSNRRYERMGLGNGIRYLLRD